MPKKSKFFCKNFAGEATYSPAILRSARLSQYDFVWQFIYPTLGSVKVSPSRVASPENYQHQTLKVSGVTPRPELPPITLYICMYDVCMMCVCRQKTRLFAILPLENRHEIALYRSASQFIFFERCLQSRTSLLSSAMAMVSNSCTAPRGYRTLR